MLFRPPSLVRAGWYKNSRRVFLYTASITACCSSMVSTRNLTSVRGIPSLLAGDLRNSKGDGEGVGTSQGTLS